MIFSHDGDWGDTIAAMCLMRQLGGGDLVLFPTHTRVRYTPEHVAGIAPLLERQSYVKSVRYADHPHDEGLNLGAWRHHYRSGLNLVDMYYTWTGRTHPDREAAWMTCDDPNPVAEVVFARSSRYHGSFPWRRAVKLYQGRAVYLGLPDEHERFCAEFGEVPYHPTPNLWEAARIIAGAKLTCVNQTSLFWVAEAMKRPVALEVCGDRGMRNCEFTRRAQWAIESSTGLLPDWELLAEVSS